MGQIAGRETGLGTTWAKAGSTKHTARCRGGGRVLGSEEAARTAWDWIVTVVTVGVGCGAGGAAASAR